MKWIIRTWLREATVGLSSHDRSRMSARFVGTSQALGLLGAIAIFTSLALVSHASAQSGAYTRLDVRGRVQIELPESWTISDAARRAQVKELTEGLLGRATHVTALSAQSYPLPANVFVRVSFLPLSPPLTQRDVVDEVKSNRKQVIEDLAEVWRSEAPQLWTALAKNNVREVGQPSFDVEPLGGATALVIRYQRTSPLNSAHTMRVAQYHVPLGTEKAIVTLTYLQGDGQAKAEHDRLKKSLVIR